MEKRKSGYALQIDLKGFFPGGQWERMTQEEKAAWKKKWEAYKKRRKGART